MTLAVISAAPACLAAKLEQADLVPSAPVRWSEAGSGGAADFTTHVQPLLGKLGCNGRSCHGSFQGQNGFRLSLFGHDGKLDHAELTTDEGHGPRVDTKQPAKSLALIKATGGDDHEGGERISVGSWQYRLLRDWIAGGAKYDHEQTAKIEHVDVMPKSFVMAADAQKPRQLRVIATFGDRSREDVTSLTVFSTNDDSVAKVSESGSVSVAGRGDTAIVATYAGVVVTSQVIVPHTPTDAFPEFPANNAIDQFVKAKLEKVGIHPSDLAGDEEFLRRVYLDLIGTLPTTDEAREFLADARPDKRARLIDQLLERPEYALYWATKFSDWTGNDSRFTPVPRSRTAWLWYDWLKDKLQRNVPYDELVGGFVTATTREGRTAEAMVEDQIKLRRTLEDGFEYSDYAKRRTNDMFWKKATNGKADAAALQVAYAFLGVRLECAQCHKHPFDRWTQDDFEQFTRFFAVVDRGLQKDIPKDMMSAVKSKKDKKFLPVLEVYVSSKSNKGDPKLLGGDIVPLKEGQDPREALYQWMRAPENPYLSRAIANRLWGHYFGKGIVNPVDDFNAANPPSNPQLLDWLARDFVEHGFDLKHLHRTILNSRTYQHTWRPNETNRLDERNFSHALLRRMPAEVVVDAINQVTGTTDEYSPGDAPEGTRAIGLAPSRLRGNGPEYELSIFGRPLRTQTCDCERSGDTGLAQAMYLLNDTSLNGKIADPEGRLAKLLAKIPDDRQMVEELFLLVLSRRPRADELERSLAFASAAKDRTAGMQDLLWSLINLREFVFVH